MLGLFGTLFTIVYTIQYRRKRWWNVGHSNDVPHTLVPLYLALATFCAGLALHASLTDHTIAIVVTGAWGALTLLFLIRFLLTVTHGIRRGWDTPMLESTPMVAGWRKFVGWPAFVMLLLFSNMIVLGWWGNLRLNATTTDTQFTATAESENALTLRPFTQSDPLVADSTIDSRTLVPRIQIKGSPALSATITTTLGISMTFEADSNPRASAAVLTLVPAQLLVTPTPDVHNDELPVIVIATSDIDSGSNAAVSTVTTSDTPTPSAAPTAQVPSTPAPTLQASVNSLYGANLRAAPTTAAEVVVLLPNQTELTVLGRLENGEWFLVQIADGREGWIASQLLAGQDVIDAAPSVDNPLDP